MDDILQDINKMNQGCLFGIGITRIPWVAHADNMVLLSKNYEGLDKLYKEFKLRIDSLELKINVNKTKCIIFQKLKRVNNNIYLNYKIPNLRMCRQLNTWVIWLILTWMIDSMLIYKLSCFYKHFIKCVAEKFLSYLPELIAI